jgi:acyl-CoA thioester hydrolase
MIKLDLFTFDTTGLNEMTDRLITYEGQVRQEWIDYNGHLNDACYVIVFSKAIDNLMDIVGLDKKNRDEHQISIYTIQSMIHYLCEVGLNEPLRVEAQLLDSDNKKLRVFFTMLHGETAVELATMETLLLHMDMSSRRSAPFLPHSQSIIDEIQQVHSELPMPALAGKSIQIRRK